MNEATTPLLELRRISKSFGPIRALFDVNLTVAKGEVHALVGENGAGKSTLMKILSGVLAPDAGAMELAGGPYAPSSPAAGRAAGVAMIYQELTLAPHLSVADNVVLGREESVAGFVRRDDERIVDCLSVLGHGDLDLNQPVGQLSVGMKQVVEIARALHGEAKVVIMDEPTSSLSVKDSRALFDGIRKLREKGISVIYISHFLEEVLEVSDRYTVLRDGANAAVGETANATMGDIVAAMIGRSLTEMFPERPRTIGKPVLEVADLAGERNPTSVSFTLRKGEILGVAGLVGSGRTETLRCLFGLDRPRKGRMRLPGGEEISARDVTPRRALAAGLDMLSENRKEEGLATTMSIAANVTLSCLRRLRRLGFLRLGSETSIAKRWCDALSVKRGGEDQSVGDLSGGNQQKVAIARLLNQDGTVFFMDEPTRGIDVGSKADIYALMLELAAKGKGIVFVSSYLPELFGVCDTLTVMHRGRNSPVKPVSEWTEADVMRFAASG